jgi:hypothetical protein
MNLQTAKTLKQGQMIYHATKKNVDGTPMRARVTSIKTWKREPEKIIVSVKHGLYDYAKFTEDELDQLIL